MVLFVITGLIDLNVCVVCRTFVFWLRTWRLVFAEKLCWIEDPRFGPPPFGPAACEMELTATLMAITDVVNRFLKLRCMIRSSLKKKLFCISLGRQLICPSTSAKRERGDFVTGAPV